jgi:hypothetical protein
MAVVTSRRLRWSRPATVSARLTGMPVGQAGSEAKGAPLAA